MSVPAPTPVMAMSAAIANPRRSSMAISGVSEAASVSLQVDAALELAAGPASRARVVGIEGQAGAGCATDGGVSLFVEREERNGALVGVLPDIARSPLGEGAELGEDFAGGQGEELVRL